MLYYGIWTSDECVVLIMVFCVCLRACFDVFIMYCIVSVILQLVCVADIDMPNGIVNAVLLLLWWSHRSLRRMWQYFLFICFFNFYIRIYECVVCSATMKEVRHTLHTYVI